MAKINWDLVGYNIVEAREQLEEIERKIKSDEISKDSFEVMLQHAFHHVNFAWNVRKVPVKRYRNMSDEDFNEWGEFPSDLELLKIDLERQGKRIG